MAQLDSHLPFKLDTRDANFPRECLAWAAQTEMEIKDVIAATKKARELMTEVDCMLARR